MIAADGLERHQHHAIGEILSRTDEQPRVSLRARLEAARTRDEVARIRDLAALARERSTAAYELAMAQGNDELWALTAGYRSLVAGDRRAAARDREQARRERLLARQDRERLAAQLALAETDALTGSRTRAAGLTDLRHELDRCRRNGTVLVVVYVDVVGLKQINDTLGHAAGDELLREVVALFRINLRSYDLIVRIGGDEFLCAIPAMSEADARERFRMIASEFAARQDARGIRTGFATLREAETAAELIDRADAELIRTPRPQAAGLPVLA